MVWSKLISHWSVSLSAPCPPKVGRTLFFGLDNTMDGGGLYMGLETIIFLVSRLSSVIYIYVCHLFQIFKPFFLIVLVVVYLYLHNFKEILPSRRV